MMDSIQILDHWLSIIASLTALFLAVGGGAIVALWKKLPRWELGRWIVRTVRFTFRLSTKYGSIREFAEQCLAPYDRLMRSVKKSIRVAIVDDSPEDFPVEYLKSIGFHVQVFQTIPLATVDSLRQFDVVFLDIAGVVPEHPRDGGVKILQKLTDPAHKKRPIVIAVSAQQFKMEHTQFFKSAHDRVDKPIDEMRCESILMDALDPFKLAKKLDLAINEARLSVRQREAVLWHMVEYLKRERSWEGTDKKFRKQQWVVPADIKIMADGVKRWVK